MKNKTKTKNKLPYQSKFQKIMTQILTLSLKQSYILTSHTNKIAYRTKDLLTCINTYAIRKQATTNKKSKTNKPY